MIVNSAIIDELWDTQPPIVPNPSRLFHLEPMGLGTAYVESLTSYVARLAEAHSVPPGTLLAIEVKPMVRQGYAINPLNSSSIVSLYGQSSVKALNGTQLGAKQLVKALEELTLRNDLQFLTLLPWAEVFPVRGLLRHFQAWCPDCYQEWQNHQQIIYSPLLWALQAVKICPAHHRPLESKCPYCDREFLPLWRDSQPGFCLRCGGWLGNNCQLYPKSNTLFEPTEEFKQQLWIAQSLGELMASAPNLISRPPRNTIKTMLEAYVHQYTQDNVSAFGRKFGLSRYEIIRWYSGVTIPNLDKLLLICYTLSTNLTDFLQRRVVPLASEQHYLLTAKPKKRQRSSSKVNFRNTNEREQLLEAMQLALEEEPPPSLTQLALRLGYKSYSSLTACSKSLSAALTARYVDYQQQLRLERIRNVLESALDSNEYPPPSLQKVARRTGISLGTFYCHCPLLCRAVSFRYEDYRKFHQKQMIAQGLGEVRKLAPILYAQGITPTVKNMRKFMQHPSTLWHVEVVEALSEVRRSLED